MVAQLPVGPTRIRLPDPSTLDASKPEAVTAYLRTLNTALSNAFAQRPAVTMATAEALLLSPNGSVYALTVSDAGAITATMRQNNAPLP